MVDIKEIFENGLKNAFNRLQEAGGFMQVHDKAPSFSFDTYYLSMSVQTFFMEMLYLINRIMNNDGWQGRLDNLRTIECVLILKHNLDYMDLSERHKKILRIATDKVNMYTLSINENLLYLLNGDVNSLRRVLLADPSEYILCLFNYLFIIKPKIPPNTLMDILFEIDFNNKNVTHYYVSGFRDATIRFTKQLGNKDLEYFLDCLELSSKSLSQ